MSTMFTRSTQGHLNRRCISAESGIRTFRAADGLWEKHRIEDVATPEAWKRNPELVWSLPSTTTPTTARS